MDAAIPTGKELRRLHDTGTNIMAHLRRACGVDHNAEAIIAASYDLQAGSYVRQREDPQQTAQFLTYARAVAAELRPLGAASVLEAGVGEATTLCDVVEELGIAPKDAWGFDLCWSRVAVGQEYSRKRGLGAATLFTGSLFNIPVGDDAFDVVYTSHSIEPNRGRELEAVRELYRIARSHVVLIEPIYELADAAARARMDTHGYCRGLYDQVVGAGMTVRDYRLLSFSTNRLNPSGVIVIEKQGASSRQPHFICPQSHAPLRPVAGSWFCEESYLVYPVLHGVPCLLPGNGILASKYPEVAGRAPESVRRAG